MRTVVVVLVSLVALAGVAWADDEEIDLVTIMKIQQAAAQGYATSFGVAVRNLHKSKAKGEGYCGEVLVEGSEDTYTPFHVLFGADGPTVIRQADYGTSDDDSMAKLMNDLLRAFGCIDG